LYSHAFILKMQTKGKESKYTKNGQKAYNLL
jgi:hypothetical protein